MNNSRNPTANSEPAAAIRAHVQNSLRLVTGGFVMLLNRHSAAVCDQARLLKRDIGQRVGTRIFYPVRRLDSVCFSSVSNASESLSQADVAPREAPKHRQLVDRISPKESANSGETRRTNTSRPKSVAVCYAAVAERQLVPHNDRPIGSGANEEPCEQYGRPKHEEHKEPNKSLNQEQPDWSM